MEYTWEYDAPSGVYKSNAMSKDLLKLAARRFRFVPFTKPVKGYGKRQGEKVTLPYYKTLAEPVTAKLEEQTRIPIDKLEMGTYTITIEEWGRGVEFTGIAEDLSALSPKEGAQKRLIEQMDASMDTAAAGAFMGTNAKVAFIPTSLTGGVFDTDGTPSTTATVALGKDHIAAIRDYMANSLHVPFYEGDYYICLAATKALRGLKNDKILMAFNLYLQKGDILLRNEVGMFENTRFCEVNHESALSNGVGSGSVLGEAVMFGEDAVGRLEIEFPHLRADMNYQSDFGRKKAVAWYGTVAFDVLFQSATDRECRIVKVVSA